MRDRRQLAAAAIASALRIRKQTGHGLADPLCPVTCASELGIEVRFLDVPSMEGVYTSGPPPAIVVSSLRPPGRRAFTCGHEIGHHCLRHGDQFDEYVEGGGNGLFIPEEYQADCFSAHLLMPKTAVVHAFSKRDLSPRDCPATMAYAVASALGVGYSSLVNQLAFGLDAIDAGRRVELLRSRPRQLRSEILGIECKHHLVVADQHWQRRAIDLEIDDWLLLPPGSEIEGESVEVIDSSRTVARARAPGRARVVANDWSAFVRVCRRGYVGRAIYRFLEEPTDG